jgi:predicted nucleotidyltransferase
MLTKSDILQYLEQNREFFRTRFGINTVAVFGSYARDEQNELSDIDLLITMLPGTENMFDKRLAFRDLLTEQFDRKVDVCYEQAIKTQFHDLIFKDAIYA